MLKKTLSLILATALACSAGSALALNYSGSQGNEATFELLDEARVSAPAAVQHLELNESKTFVSFPVLDGIPEDTVYVYRSANLYGGRAAGRMNTNLLVYADTHFDTSDAALAYLKGLGLTDIIDAAIGSILLVTPADGVAFGQADQGNYYKLQTAICSLQAGGTDADGNAVTYAEPEYFGGFGYIYAIGIDGGASFLNNYVATTYDFVTRLAGMLLINGTMESRSQAAAPVPVYLVNAGEDVVRKYCAINGVNVAEETAETVSRYNQELPLQRVVTADGSLGDAWYVNDAYHGLFVKAMRLPVGKAGLYSAGTPYQGLGNDKAPYSLCERTDISSGVTAGGLTMIRRDEDRFSAYATETGEYIQTWFEYLPQDVLDNTAAPGSVPLILGIHGTNDDPRQYVDEIGLLSLAEHEHIAIVAPEHNALGALDIRIETEALAALVNYMLETYPALDSTRVYATGYSMGGGSTMKAILSSPDLFAAAVPMSPVTFFGEVWVPSEEELAQFANIDLPVMLTASGADLPFTYDSVNDRILDALQGLVNQMLSINEMPAIQTFDFEANPFSGFRADRLVTRTLNNEYINRTWYLEKDGVPLVALNLTEGLTHALYPEYGKVFWDFVKHYSRDAATGEIVYDPYVS